MIWMVTQILYREIQMLVEFNFVLFSFILLFYSARHYFKRKDRYLFYLTLCFTFLALSNTLQMFTSIAWVYNIQINLIILKLLELVVLALYACFTICAIVALRKILEKMHL